MSLLAANADYTDRDFTALRARLRSLVRSVFPKWTNAQVVNFANLLLELYCWVGDVLGFYQDNQAGESRMATATQLKNMIALARHLGYEPRSPRAASTDITITLAEAVGEGKTVTFTPPWKGLANPLTAKNQDTDSPLEFELQANIVISAGETQGTGSVKNSIHIGDPDDLTDNPGETFESTDLPNQRYTLAQGPYLDGSVVVSDDLGDWEQAENNSLVTADAEDRVFRIELDENGLATLLFGDGVTGAIPSGTVRLAYEIGGGEDGNNVVADALNKIDGQFVDSVGDSVTIASVTHAAPSDGLEAETLEEIREHAPLSIQTLSRTVTKGDYENQAVLAGMRRALMVTQTENGGLRANTAILYCVPAGANDQGGKVSDAQRDDVNANISQEASTEYPHAKPGIVGFTVTILTAPYVDIGIAVRLYLRKSAASSAATKTATAEAIVAALQAYFALLNDDGTTNELVDFGLNLGEQSPTGTREIALSDIAKIITAIPGVREIGDATDDLKLVAYRVTDDTDGYTGGSTPAEVVQALSHADVPLAMADFPRLKMAAFGGVMPTVKPDITILDGDDGDAQLYPPT